MTETIRKYCKLYRAFLVRTQLLTSSRALDFVRGNWPSCQLQTTKRITPCIHTWAFFSEKYSSLRDHDKFLCNPHINAICRLFLENQKALNLFCLFLAKILVRLLVFLEGKLTTTSHSKACKVIICLEQIRVLDVSHAGGRSVDK